MQPHRKHMRATRDIQRITCSMQGATRRTIALMRTDCLIVVNCRRTALRRRQTHLGASARAAAAAAWTQCDELHRCADAVCSGWAALHGILCSMLCCVLNLAHGNVHLARCTFCVALHVASCAHDALDVVRCVLHVAIAHVAIVATAPHLSGADLILSILWPLALRRFSVEKEDRADLTSRAVGYTTEWKDSSVAHNPSQPSLPSGRMRFRPARFAVLSALHDAVRQLAECSGPSLPTAARRNSVGDRRNSVSSAKSESSSEGGLSHTSPSRQSGWLPLGPIRFDCMRCGAFAAMSLHSLGL